jgi:hypothetical protein
MATVTTTTASNTCAFKEFFPPLSVLPSTATASWRMRVTYTSKVVMKILGCTL